MKNIRKKNEKLLVFLLPKRGKKLIQKMDEKGTEKNKKSSKKVLTKSNQWSIIKKLLYEKGRSEKEVH